MTTRLTTADQLISPPVTIILKQVHGNTVIHAENSPALLAADAVYTTEENIVCAIKTADCLPILICDKKGSCVAAIHAGWRGIAAGIIENTLHQLSVMPENMLIWLGPAIGKDKFEVRADMRGYFSDEKDVQAFTRINQYPPHQYLCDIKLLVINRLKKFKIPADHIYSEDLCTFSEDNLFYSYRRDSAETRRMMSMIWLTF